MTKTSAMERTATELQEILQSKEKEMEEQKRKQQQKQKFGQLLVDWTSAVVAFVVSSVASQVTGRGFSPFR